MDERRAQTSSLNTRASAPSKVMRRHPLRLFEKPNEILGGNFDVSQDRPNQSAPQILSTMHRNDGGPAVCVLKIRMASFLPKQLETQMAEHPSHLGRSDDRELAQALSSTWCRPMNLF